MMEDSAYKLNVLKRLIIKRKIDRMKASQSHDSLVSLQTNDSLDTSVARKYQKISASARNELLNQIFFKGKKIKKAAKDLKINYSSAKTILHLYRKKFKSQNTKLETDNTEVGYRKLGENEIGGNIKIISTMGGQVQQPQNQKTQNMLDGDTNDGQQQQNEQNIVKQIICRVLMNLIIKRSTARKITRPIIIQHIDRTIFQ